MNYQIKRLSFEKTWLEAFSLYKTNFMPLLVISLFGCLPILVLPDPLLNPGAGDPAKVAFSTLIAWFIALVGLNTMAKAFLVEFLYRRYSDRPGDLGLYVEDLRPLLGRILLMSVAQAVIVTLGFILFVIPGIYMVLSLSVAVEALVVERGEVMPAIKRSLYLTRGKKPEIFVSLMLLGLISLGVETILGRMLSVFDRGQAMINIDLLLLYLTQALTTPLSAAIFLLVYFGARIEKEGYSGPGPG